MNNSQDKNLEQSYNYWITSSDKDFEVMQSLFERKYYHWALFMGHLVLEKLLKAYYVKVKNDFPPLVHDLRRLGQLAGFEFDNERIVMLDTVSQFNIKARYDDYKQNFYNLCTAEFSTVWNNNIKELRQWIKTLL